MKYWAFLSYNHTDKKWGDWLHKDQSLDEAEQLAAGNAELLERIARARECLLDQELDRPGSTEKAPPGSLVQCIR